MIRKLLLIIAAVAGLGVTGTLATSTPAAAQGFYFGYDQGSRHYDQGPRHYGPPPPHRGWGYGPPPPRHHYRERYRGPRDCERVRVRYFDGYGWRVRTERRCYRGW